jgi:plasmid stabilization system protein ParE
MRISWTQTAVESFEEITDYIFERFSAKEVNDFIIKSEERIHLILQNNSIGLQYKKTAYRQFLIAEQTYLFYRMESDVIYLLVFWNNAKNPLDLDRVLRF